jgi:Flp pilus assembly pilin Flp
MLRPSPESAERHFSTAERSSRARQSGGDQALHRGVAKWITWARADDGQTLVEYSLILLLMALVCITALTSIGQVVTSMFDAVLAAF